MDLVAYNTLIHAAAASADADLALALLDGMEQAGLKADLHAFNGVLHSLVGAQRVQQTDLESAGGQEPEPLDLIGKAGEIRDAMAAAGVEEDEARPPQLPWRACLRACVLACLPACLLACLPACLLACLRACVLACLPACLLAC